MKNRSLVRCLLAFAALSAAGQVFGVDCTPDEITLSSQAEVDNFQADHGPGCDTVVTGLTIDGASITDLTPLSGLTTISTTGPFTSSHTLQIGNTSLTSLAGLENLVDIRWLELRNNTSLTSISALSNLVQVRGPIFVEGNSVLTNLDGLDNITALNGGALYIQDNPLLSDLGGVSNISTINASLVISNNDSLTDLDDFAGLQHVSSNISITYNDGLTNIGGLAGMVGFDAVLNIRFNTTMTGLGSLPNLVDLNGLIIYSNNQLASLDGLENVTNIGNGAGLSISYNNALTDIGALSGLVSSNWQVEVRHNSQLADCSALSTLLDSVDDDVTGPGPGPDGIPDVLGEVTIENNDDGCNSIQDITGEIPAPDIELRPVFGSLDSHAGALSLVNPDNTCDWEPGETVEIWWDAPEMLLATTEADEDGCFQALFKLDSEKIPGSSSGLHDVEARGSVTGTSTAAYEQVEPQLLLTPSEGASGRLITAEGCFWTDATTVEVTWLDSATVLDNLAVDEFGCIDSQLKLPREKNGIFVLQAESDNAQASAAAYRMFLPDLGLVPAEGPADSKIPALGCNWFPEEVIEYKFAFENLVIDTGGTDTSGCLAANSAEGSTVYIPPDTPAGDYTIQATGQLSNLRAKVPFKVVDRTLEYDPPNGAPGDPVALSGCGWVGNDTVEIEWGFPDVNSLPITWQAPVDFDTGCFGLDSPFEINVPVNTITGPLEQIARGNVSGEITSEFMVNHDGTIAFPNPDGVVGHTITVDVHDAIIGESIIFYWKQFYDTVLGAANATETDFSVDIILPTSAGLGLQDVTARGSRGFLDYKFVNFIDTSSIMVTNTGDIPVGSILQVEGANWPDRGAIRLDLVNGDDSYFVGRAYVPDGSITFSTGLPLPVDAPPGSYVLTAENDDGYHAETSVTLVDGPLPAFGLAAGFAPMPPVIDGILSVGEWDYEQKVDLANGYITARSDDTRLYLLFNLLDDTTANALGSDTFWITFDVFGNEIIDDGFDLNFLLDGDELVLDEYTGPNSFNARNSTFLRSNFAAGFDCFTADGSATSDLNSSPPVQTCDQHRVFEVAIDLNSILAEPGDLLRVGFRVQSQTPAFTEDLPENFPSDFSELGLLQLADSTLPGVPPNGTVTDIGAAGFEIEVTQATQDTDNAQGLVADKPTAVRVYTSVASEALVRTYLYGRRNGAKLPGSPLVTLATVPAAVVRDEMAHTSNFLLPDSWVSEGTIELQAVTENYGGQNTRTHVELFTFEKRVVPDYWIIPINSSSTSTPTLVADSDIAIQQSYLETVFPLHDVNWVRKDWTEIGAVPIGSKKPKDWLPDVNNAIGDYFDDLIKTHSDSLAESGQEPFTLPDQIYGFTSMGGGLAASATYNDERRVSSGFYGTSGDLTMAHEINHNLDSGSPRTWGNHTTDADDNTDNANWGCAAKGGNTAWPRTDDEIGDTGFDTRLPWQPSGTAQVTVVPDNFPDYMSYCRSEAESNGVTGQLPFKWTSPYRWSSQFDKFEPPPFAFSGGGGPPTPEMVYYVSGTILLAGTGSLNPVTTQLGTLGLPGTPGDWSLEIQDSGGGVLWSAAFEVSFTSEEGDDLEQVYFRYRLPFQETGAKIVLKHLGAVLDTLEASAHPPVVELLEPSGGETWGEEETIVWTAEDEDADDLYFSLSYSPDGGNRWYPLARRLTGFDHTFRTAGLPAGEGGVIRLVATDGFHTVTTESDGAFTVPPPSPVVVIEAPLEGQVFEPGTWINLRGAATLPGGGEEGLSYAWLLDDGLLEQGPSARAMLQEGQYALTLLAWDGDGFFGSQTLVLLVEENDPPNPPILPWPVDGGADQSIDAVLSWLGGDTDGDPVTYDVFLEAGNPNPAALLCDDTPLSECATALAPGTLYYWRVTARDDKGLEAESETWSFTTGELSLDEVIFADGFE